MPETTAPYQVNGTATTTPSAEDTYTLTNDSEGDTTITIDGSTITLKPGEQIVVDDAGLKSFTDNLDTGNPPLKIDKNIDIPNNDNGTPPTFPITPFDGLPFDPNTPDSAAQQNAPQPIPGLKVSKTDNLPNERKFADTPGTQSTHRSMTPIKEGDPVNLFTGAFEISDTDVLIPGGAFDLVFTRNYKSGIPFAGPLGWGWDHNHNSFIRAIDGMTDVYGRWSGDVHEDLFVKQSDGSFLPPPGVFDKFEEITSSVFKVTKPGGTVYTYDQIDTTLGPNRFYLSSIIDRFNNELRYTYAAEDGYYHLTQVTDMTTGRALYFHYGSCGLLEQLSDDYDRVWHFYHDNDIEHHIGVKYPSCDEYPNGYLKRYDYPDAFTVNSTLSHAVVRVYDGDGNTFIANEYEEDPANYSYGRVIRQYAGEFTYAYDYEQLQWAPQRADLVDQQTQVTSVQMPDGSVRSYVFNYRGDVLEQRIRLAADGSVITTNHVYDQYGRLLYYLPVRSAMALPPDVLTANEFYVKMDYVKSSYTTGDDYRDFSLLERITLHRPSSSTQPDALDNGIKIIWQGEYHTTNQLLKASYDVLPADGLTSPSSFKTQYNYTSGFLTSITLPTVQQPDHTSQSATIQLTQSGTHPGRIGTITSPLLKVTSYTYGTTNEANGRLTTVTSDVGGLNLTEQINYSTSITPASRNYGMPISAQDPTGVTKLFTFNSMGRLSQIDLPAVAGLTGRVSFEYDADGFITSVKSPKGSYTGTADAFIETRIERDVMREIRKVTMGSNTNDTRTMTRKPNYAGQSLQEADPIGTITKAAYDERGLPLYAQSVGSDGKKTPIRKQKYDKFGNIIEAYESVISGSGEVHYNKSTFTYDGYQRPLSAQRADSVKSEVKYDWVQELVDKTKTTYGIELYNPLLIETVYDASNNIKARKISEFDKRGRLIQVREADAPTNVPATSATFIATQFFYDADNNLKKIVGPRSGGTQVTLYDYDGANRLIKVTDPELNITEFTYDAAGRVLTTVVKDVNSAYASLTTTYAYDPDRKRLISVTTPDGVVFKTEYDDRDLPITTKLPTTFDDAIERRYLRSYGMLGEILSTTADPDGLNLVSSWIYNKANQPIQFQDPAGSITTYLYDSLGRPTGVDYPDGNTIRQSYDAHSRPYQTTYSYGTVTTASYYEIGLLQSLSITPGSGLEAVPTHNYQYDALNRLTNATAGTSAITRTYDSLNRLTSEATASLTLTQDYTNFTSGTFDRLWTGATNRTERFTLNKNNVVTAIDRTLPGPTVNLSTITALNGPDSIKAATQLAGTITMNASYDQQKRLYDISYIFPGETETLKYRYDSRGRRRVETTWSTAQPATNKSSKNDLDNKDRLLTTKTGALNIPAMSAVINTQANHNTDITTNVVPALGASPSESFTYNASGSDKGDARVSYTDLAGNVINYTSDGAHKLTNAGINGSFSYQAGGTRSQDAGRDFTIDGLGRIVSIADRFGPQTLSVTYDALGRPWKLNDGVNPVRELNYFGLELVQETVSGAADRRYTNHPMLGRIATHTAANDFQHLYDIRQNLIATLDNTAAIREIIRYDPFGFPTTTAVGAASNIEPVFGGMRHLNIKGTPPGTPTSTWPSGLYLGMYRLYDPSAGVWLSNDALGYIDGPNMSAYVGHNPVGMIDPLGLSGQRDRNSLSPNSQGKPIGNLGNLEFQFWRNEARHEMGMSPLIGDISFDQNQIPDWERIFVERYAAFRNAMPSVDQFTATLYARGQISYNGIGNFRDILRSDYLPVFTESSVVDLQQYSQLGWGTGSAIYLGQNWSGLAWRRFIYNIDVSNNPYPKGTDEWKLFRREVKINNRNATSLPMRAILDEKFPIPSETDVLIGSYNNATKTAPWANRTTTGLGIFGGALLIYGAYSTFDQVSNAEDPAKEATAQGFSWAAAIALGESGAALGLYAGPYAWIASPVLFLAGSIAGGIGGYEVGKDLYCKIRLGLKFGMF